MDQPEPIDVEKAREAIDLALVKLRRLISEVDEVLSAVLSADAALSDKGGK